MGLFYTLFIDGDQRGNGAEFSGVPTDEGSIPGPWRMGDPDGAHACLGYLDDVAFYPRCLTPGQIADHFSGAGAYRDRVLADNPACYFEFEETSGQVIDSSGNGLHGDPNGTVIRGNAGVHGDGVFLGAFDETITYGCISGIDLTHDMSWTGKWTMEAFFKRADPYPNNHLSRIFAKGTPGAAEAYMAACSAGFPRLETRTEDGQAIPGQWTSFDTGLTDPEIAADRWLHLAVTWTPEEAVEAEGWGILIP